MAFPLDPNSYLPSKSVSLTSLVLGFCCEGIACPVLDLCEHRSTVEGYGQLECTWAALLQITCVCVIHFAVFLS